MTEPKKCCETCKWFDPCNAPGYTHLGECEYPEPICPDAYCIDKELMLPQEGIDCPTWEKKDD